MLKKESLPNFNYIHYNKRLVMNIKTRYKTFVFLTNTIFLAFYKFFSQFNRNRKWNL